MSRATPVAFCCPKFRDSHASRGDRGAYIVVVRHGDGPTFLHCGAAVAMQDRAEFLRQVVVPIAVSLFWSTGIRFCPWCGVSLYKYYGKESVWSAMIDDDFSKFHKLVGSS